MVRFVMAKKRQEGSASKKSAAAGMNWSQILGRFNTHAEILHDLVLPGGKDPYVLLFEADEEEVAANEKNLPAGILLEREVLHWPQTRLAPHGRPGLVVRARSGTTPLAGALITLMVRDGFRGAIPQQRTNASGTATFPVDTSMVDQLIVTPLTGYWSMATFPTDEVVVDCAAIQFPADGLGWWHHDLGIHTRDDTRGRGIKVGVLDSGAGRHEALEHVTHVGTWRNGKHFADENPSGLETLHGTHVCGIIGGRPRDRGFCGIAPGVELLSGCLGVPEEPVGQADIVNGVRTLAEVHQVDLLNLSYGSLVGSKILEQALLHAEDAGCLCICAAGNKPKVVMWPACADGAVAVSAVGRQGSAPADSFPASRLATAPEYDAGDGLFLASFSGYGSEIDCCGPGVGIVSAVPEHAGVPGRSWVSLDGTSMAAPAVASVLAVCLARSSRYTTSTRNAKRSRLARKILVDACQRNRLDDIYQGHGMPRVNA